MKILLTHGYFLSEDKKETKIMKPYAPLGILYISAYLGKHGYQNEIYDSTFSSFEKLSNHILQSKPDLIGIYTNLMTKLNVLKIIKFIRSNNSLRDCKIILGGPEIRYSAENFLKYGADIVVPGEGEETMLELMKSFYENNFKDLPEIKGIAFKEGEKITFTNERELIKDLDTVPFPARNKIDLSLYFNTWKDQHGYSTISVSTMRGCPYTCKWCSRSIYGNSYRRRNAVLVVDEIRMLKEKYSPDIFWFVDDVFTINHKWLNEFGENIKKQNLKIQYECISRPDRMNEAVIKQLKESGCKRIWIGAESGSQNILDAMDRRVKIAQVREMISLCKSYGIETGTFIMFGYPGETLTDIEKTIEHLKVSDPDLYTVTVAYPIKGTDLYNEVENAFIDNYDWDRSTDRDIDFKRNYSKEFYKNVIRYAHNEIMHHKSKNLNGSGNILKSKSYKLKSIIARNLMRAHMYCHADKFLN